MREVRRYILRRHAHAPDFHNRTYRRPSALDDGLPAQDRVIAANVRVFRRGGHICYFNRLVRPRKDGGLPRHPRDRRFQLLEIDRLGEVLGEAGLAAAVDVFFHAEAAQGNPLHGTFGQELAHEFEP